MSKSLLDFYNEAHGIKKKITFLDCGLDIDMNILQAPVCECGCGEYMSVVLEDNYELADFISSMLEIQECQYCAIYAVMTDNKVMIGTNIDGEISINIFRYQDETIPGYEFVKEWQEECQYHCYGLLQQNEDGKSYKIVME